MSASPQDGLDKLQLNLERLKTTRVELDRILSAKLSAYAKDKLIWADHSKFLLHPITLKDAKHIEVIKRSFLIIKEMETLLQFLQEYQKKHFAMKLFYLPQAAYRSFDAIYNQLVGHLMALHQLVDKAELATTIKSALNDLSLTLTGLSWADMSIDGLRKQLTSAIPDVTQILLRITNHHLDLDRPIVSLEVENVYPTTLVPKPKPVTAQSKSEWFPLLDPMREVMNGSRRIASLLTEYMATRHHDSLNATELDYVIKSRKALERSVINKSGYFEYLEHEETDLSQSLKAVFNLLLTLDKLVKGLPKKPTMADFAQMTALLMKNTVNTTKRLTSGLEHLGAIEFDGIGPGLKMFANQILNSMLNYIGEYIYPKMYEVVNLIHQVELNNNLRYNSLMPKSVAEIMNPLLSFAFSQGVIFPEPSDHHLFQQYIEGEVKDWRTAKEVAEAEEKVLSRLKPLMEAYVGVWPSFSSHQELLTNLEELRRLGLVANPAQQAALSSFEQVVLDELPLKTKIELHRKAQGQAGSEWVELLGRTIVSETERSKRWFYQRFSDYVVKESQEIWNWPPPGIELIQKLVDQRIRSNAAVMRFYEQTQDSLSEIKAFEQRPSEFALHYLEKNGFNYLMRASQAGEKEAALNIGQKRILAVIVAGIQNEKVVQALKEAHGKATQFVGPLAQGLIENLAQHNQSLAKVLAVEMTLGGWVPPSSWPSPSLLQFQEGEAKQAALPALRMVLKTLEAEQVFALLKDPARARLLQAIFELSPIKDSLSKEDLLTICLERWQKADKELQYQLALFVGRLAHQDKEFATRVFSEKQGPALLKAAGDAVYYQALVSTFTLKHPYLGKQDRDYASLLADYAPVITKIVEDMHPGKLSKNENVVDLFLNSPHQLCALLDRFSHTRLAAGSAAEDQMKILFSNLIMSQGEQGLMIRDRMLGTLLSSSGYSQAPYFNWLVPEATFDYWQQAKTDLKDLKDNRIRDLKGKTAELGYYAIDWAKYVSEQGKKLEKLLNEDKEARKLPIYLRYVKQELESMSTEAEEKFQYFKAQMQVRGGRSTPSPTLFDSEKEKVKVTVQGKKETEEDVHTQALIKVLTHSIKEMKGELDKHVAKKKDKYKAKTKNAKSLVKDEIAEAMAKYYEYMQGAATAAEKLVRSRETIPVLADLKKRHLAALAAHNKESFFNKAGEGEIGKLLEALSAFLNKSLPATVAARPSTPTPPKTPDSPHSPRPPNSLFPSASTSDTDTTDSESEPDSPGPPKPLARKSSETPK